MKRNDTVIGSMPCEPERQPDLLADAFVADADFVALNDKIRNSMAKIPPEKADTVGMFAHFNTEGTRPPIFWCFNKWSEAVFLSYWLGPDQPLYAMRSMHALVESKAVKKLHTLTLTRAYSENVVAIGVDALVIVGGKCQAGQIAEAVAQDLISETGDVPLLITLDHQPPYCYPAQVIMLLGSRSGKYNPFLSGEDPTPPWLRKHRAHCWGIVDGDHGRYFVEPSVHELVAHIRWAGEQIRAGQEFRSGRIALHAAGNCPGQGRVARDVPHFSRAAALGPQDHECPDCDAQIRAGQSQEPSTRHLASRISGQSGSRL